MRIPALIAAILLAVCPAICSAQSVEWQSWSSTPFKEAARQHKFVILEIESAGSHWCHVMDQETFAGSAVKELIEQSYIAVRVDASACPDVANRYRDHELPATIIFNSDGSEIVRKQRFLSGRQMVSLLKAVVEDPTPVDSIRPEPSISYSTSPVLAKDLSETLSGKFNSQYGLPAPPRRPQARRPAVPPRRGSAAPAASSKRQAAAPWTDMASFPADEAQLVPTPICTRGAAQ